MRVSCQHDIKTKDTSHVYEQTPNVFTKIFDLVVQRPDLWIESKGNSLYCWVWALGERKTKTELNLVAPPRLWRCYEV